MLTARLALLLQALLLQELMLLVPRLVGSAAGAAVGYAELLRPDCCSWLLFGLLAWSGPSPGTNSGTAAGFPK